MNASASSGVGAGAATGLVGFDLCGGGAGASVVAAVPFVLGASKAPGIVADGGVEAEDAVPFGTSVSISIGSDIIDSAENLLLANSRSSLGRFSGWVSASSVLRREVLLEEDL